MEKKKEASELYYQTMTHIKKTKCKLTNVIKYINETKINLGLDINEHLKKLIKLWNNNSNADTEYYVNMKEHHSYINGKIENEILNKLWMDYIVYSSELRVKLMKLNHLCSELQENKKKSD